MSKIGKKPISIPKGVEVKLEGNKVYVKGPKGSLELEIHSRIEIRIDKDKNELVVTRKSDEKFVRAMHGTIRSHLNNMVKGVSEGFYKELLVVGTGYKAELKGNELVLDVGYAGPKTYRLPEGIKAQVTKEGGNFKIRIEGIDKQKVGQVAAEIRKIRKPDLYKGKGIRYADEVIKLKPGKAGVKG
jgi:large subunit ribosomal protein L6